jgi:hypothetical protein
MSLQIEAASWFSVIVAQHIDMADIEEYIIEIMLDSNPPVKIEQEKKLVVGLGWLRDQLQNAMNEIKQITIPE